MVVGYPGLLSLLESEELNMSNKEQTKIPVVLQRGQQMSAPAERSKNDRNYSNNGSMIRAMHYIGLIVCFSGQQRNYNNNGSDSRSDNRRNNVSSVF